LLSTAEKAGLLVPPTIAVSVRGTLYVFWERPGQRPAPKSEELSFGPARDPEWSSVPMVSVYQKGKWSRAGLLVVGLKDGLRTCPDAVGNETTALLAALSAFLL